MRKKTQTTATGAASAAAPAAHHLHQTSPMRIQPFALGLLGGLGVLVALGIGAILGQLSTVLVYVGIALFLALGLDPLVSWLERRMPRGAAIGAVVAGVLLLFAGIVWAIVPIVITQVQNLVTDLPGMVRDIQASDWYRNLEAQYGQNVTDGINGILSFLGDAKNWPQLVGGIGQVGAGIAGGVTGGIIVLILTLYFMGSLNGMKRLAVRFVPAYQRAGFSDVMEDVTGAVGRYVIGQASLASINGVLTLILALVIGAPMPALLALFAFIGSCIPLVGTLSAAVLITGITYLGTLGTDEWWRAAIVGGWYLVYMQIEAYVISPRIMSKAVAVPGALVVIAAVAGGAIGGVLGALVAIPVAASVIIIVQKVVFPAQDSKTRGPKDPEIAVELDE